MDLLYSGIDKPKILSIVKGIKIYTIPEIALRVTPRTIRAWIKRVDKKAKG
jgi:hypothetical protein